MNSNTTATSMTGDQFTMEVVNRVGFDNNGPSFHDDASHEFQIVDVLRSVVVILRCNRLGDSDRPYHFLAAKYPDGFHYNLADDLAIWRQVMIRNGLIQCPLALVLAPSGLSNEAQSIRAYYENYNLPTTSFISLDMPDPRSQTSRWDIRVDRQGKVELLLSVPVTQL